MKDAEAQGNTPAPTPIDELRDHLAALDLNTGMLAELVEKAQAALAAKDAEIARLKAHDHFVQKQQVEPAVARPERAEVVFPTEDPDGKPYHHDPKKALAAKLALAEGDGPVSDTTAKAYVEAYATTPRSSLEIEAALLAADRLGHEDRYSPLAILADVVHYMRAERDQLRAEVEKLRQERAEWMPMYRRDYGHDWDKRTKYEGF